MRGFFTQGAALLTRTPVALDAIAPALLPFGQVRWREGSADWCLGGPTLVVPLRPDANGFIAVDSVGRAWPDQMGDPTKEPMLFGSWSTGHFGPFAYPGGLERARQQCWHWPEGKTLSASHTAFIRMKSSYLFGASPTDPVMPPDYNAYQELHHFTRMVEAVAQVKDVLCYFNPNGEVLLTPSALTESLEWAAKADLPPFDVWANVRLYGLDGLAPGWFMQDSVGMWQIDAPDHEAVFIRDRYDANEVANFLRNAALYLLRNGPIINDSETMDGPGGIRWQAFHAEQSLAAPPRQTLRWYPQDRSRRPPAIAPNAPKNRHETKADA